MIDSRHYATIGTCAGKPMHVLKLILRFKEILLKIGFIEEMRTTSGNKEVLQIFLPNFPYSRKYNLLRLTPYQFVTSHQA